MIDRSLTYPTWLRAVAQHRSRAPAVRDDGGTASFADLVDTMDAVAKALHGLGIERGDRVVTAMQPSAAHLAVLMGTMAASGVAVPLNTRLRPPEIAAYLAPIDPALIVTDAEHAGLGRAASCPAIELADALAPTSLRERLHGLVPTATDPSLLPPLDELDAALVLPTGGTTGTPKGALWDHRGVWMWMRSVATTDPRRFEDLDLFFSPFFHATLCVGVLAPLLQGSAVWIQPTFDPAKVIEALPQGITHFQCAPTMLVALRGEPRFAKTRRGGVRVVYFGSTTATEAFTRQVLEDFPHSKIRTAFGATELGGPVTRLEHEDILAGHLASVGRPLPGVGITIVDDRGAPSESSGEIGELVVNSPWCSLGYYGRERETAETFQADGIHIGDLGSLQDGWLHIAGRKKELIISGGENVFPSEVERVVVDHPAVAEAVVYGVPDERWGERVEVAIRMAPGASLNLDALRAFCADRLAGYKVPKRLVVLNLIPLTANNKPDRASVRAARMAEGAAEGPPS